MVSRKKSVDRGTTVTVDPSGMAHKRWTYHWIDRRQRLQLVMVTDAPIKLRRGQVDFAQVRELRISKWDKKKPLSFKQERRWHRVGTGEGGPAALGAVAAALRGRAHQPPLGARRRSQLPDIRQQASLRRGLRGHRRQGHPALVRAAGGAGGKARAGGGDDPGGSRPSVGTSSRSWAPSRPRAPRGPTSKNPAATTATTTCASAPKATAPSGRPSGAWRPCWPRPRGNSHRGPRRGRAGGWVSSPLAAGSGPCDVGLMTSLHPRSPALGSSASSRSSPPPASAPSPRRSAPAPDAPSRASGSRRGASARPPRWSPARRRTRARPATSGACGTAASPRPWSISAPAPFRTHCSLSAATSAATRGAGGLPAAAPLPGPVKLAPPPTCRSGAPSRSSGGASLRGAGADP